MTKNDIVNELNKMGYEVREENVVKFRAGICYRLNSIYKTDETVRRIFRSGGTSRIYLKSWT